MAYICDLQNNTKETARVTARHSRLVLVLGLIALFGAPLGASTWYFENTTLQGTFSGGATVSGYVTVTGLNFGFPVDITLNGPFGEFTDTGSGLQLDEGTIGFADTYVDFIAQQSLDTPGLTVDPLSSFTFTSVFTGSLVTDTYSLSTGELTNIAPTPEPGTAPGTLIVVLGLVGAAVWRQRRLARPESRPALEG